MARVLSSRTVMQGVELKGNRKILQQELAPNQLSTSTLQEAVPSLVVVVATASVTFLSAFIASHILMTGI